MPSIIHLLPDAIANQIAAGEVVQRPASIVKELLENSLDAQSTKITVIIHDAGKQLIQVIDDGVGMNINDARMCFEPHATSKIRNSEDLFNIHTLGFRGEALASIASVAHVGLKTKTKEMEIGTEVKIHGGKFLGQLPNNIKSGAHFTVKNIFYNVPARRKFLKSNTVEMRHIYDEFLRIALAKPNISFDLIVDKKEIFQLSPSPLNQRISKIFGDKYKNSLLKINEDTGYITLKGYIGTPKLAKRTKGEQFFFVNDRFIKSFALQAAVNQSFQGLLEDKKNPFFTLFIGINPKFIDINVHPTKTEIKFQDAQTIFSIIKSCVKQALAQFHISPSMNFDANVNWKNDLNEIVKMTVIPGKNQPDSSSSGFSQSPSHSAPKNSNEKSNFDNWQKLYEENIGNTTKKAINEFEMESPKKSNALDESDDGRILVSSAIQPSIQLNEGNDDSKGGGDFIQMASGHILYSIPSGILIFKLQEALERILFEKNLQIFNNHSTASQRYLFPITLDFSFSDIELMKDIWSEIENIGFIIEFFGKRSILLHGGPAHMQELPEKELFEGMIVQYKLEENTIDEDQLKSILNKTRRKKSFKVARALAKKGAKSNAKKLTPKEVNSIINQLFACQYPNLSLTGNPIFNIISPKVLDSLITQD